MSFNKTQKKVNKGKSICKVLTPESPGEMQRDRHTKTLVRGPISSLLQMQKKQTLSRPTC